MDTLFFCTYLEMELLGHIVDMFSFIKNCQILGMSEFQCSTALLTLGILIYSFPSIRVGWITEVILV